MGFGNLPAWMAMKAIGFAQANGLARFVSAQMYYSIAGRDIEREIVPLAQDQGIAITAVEPAGGRPAVGQVRRVQEGPRGRAAGEFRLPAGRSRTPAGGAGGAACGGQGTRPSRWRAWRWPGC